MSQTALEVFPNGGQLGVAIQNVLIDAPILAIDAPADDLKLDAIGLDVDAGG
jgi:hypothetical protein